MLLPVESGEFPVFVMVLKFSWQVKYQIVKKARKTSDVSDYPNDYVMYIYM